ncbi:MAG TPA: efflux RND transporter periplasmic adaptor subunit, partial [Desulfosarcina sp.]|nr:efflux RND transporter periplasmic adaptor subunit [Desulfosarcina sp.]
MYRKLAQGILCCCFLMSCSDKIDPGTVSGETPKTIRASTRVARLVRQPYFYEAVGTVQARQTMTLSSKLMGTVKTISVSEGDRVHAGDLLVVLEQTQVDAGLRQSEAALEEARRAHSAARSGKEAAAAEAALAKATFERYQQLIKTDSASRQEFDEVKSRYEETRAALSRADSMMSAAAQRVNQAEAALTSAKATRADASISAPYEGTVITKHVEPGDLAAPGTPLLTLEGIDSFRVDLILPETYLNAVTPGNAVDISIPNLEKASVQGIVEAVMPTADTASRSFTVKLSLPPGLPVHTGTFARILIPVAEEGRLLIPPSAVV